MIRRECIIDIGKIDFISVTCPNCKSEMRYKPGFDTSGICPTCAQKLPANYINDLLRCIHDFQTNEILKSKIGDIAIVKVENE